MKAYICGKVSGEPREECKRKFAEAETKLRVKGFEVVNPMKIVPSDCDSWAQAMKICLSHLIECDIVFTLGDHNQSRGALIEQIVANALDIPVISIETIEYIN